MPAHPGSGPAHVWAEVVGGDALGRGHEPALCWWLPEGSSVQHAYRLRTDDGFDTGQVDSPIQSYVRLPVFDQSRRSTKAQVKVWTDLGESEWSDPVRLEAGLLGDEDWTARWIGADEDPRPGQGSRPAYWLRTTVDVPAFGEARLYITALGLYEAFLDGRRVGDVELAPGYTQYRARVQYQAYDVTSLVRPGRHVLAVLLADGWYRGQVGLPRAADQYGDDVALRAQFEVQIEQGWQVVAASHPGWRVAPSHITAADLIGGQREDRRLLDPAVHDPAIEDTVFDDRSWRMAVPRDVDVAVVRSVAPPVRRVQQIRPVAVRPVRDGNAFVVDFGQNFNGWVRLALPGPAGRRLTLSHGEWLDDKGDLTTAHLDVDLPIIPEPLPLGQVDEVASAGGGDVFEPRFTTHGFRYVRVEGHPGPLEPGDISGVVVHSDLRRLGWFGCSDDRINRLHEAVVWSLRSNVCDIPTDCPQRERAGWTGDWQIFAPTAAYLYDVLAFTRKWLGDVSLDQRADGCVANMSPCPPAEGFDGPLGALNGSAGWGDVVVSAPWDLYEAYGDASLLHEAWGSMTAWVRFAAAAAAGGRHPARAAARPDPDPQTAHERYLWDTGFHWGEWLEPGAVITDFPAFVQADKSETATAYLYRSAATVARVARVLGRPEDQWRPYHVIARGRARRLAAGVRPPRRNPRRGDPGVTRAGAGVRAGARGTAADRRRAARRADRPGRRSPGDRLLVDGLPAARARRQRAPGHRVRTPAPGYAAVLAHHGGPGCDDHVGGVGGRRLPRRPARVAQPLQQGRGGHLLAPLRRGAAPHRARIPHLRGASATRRRHHLGHHAPHQPVRAHRAVLAPRRRDDGA